MADRLGPDRWAKPIGGPAPQFKPEDVAFSAAGARPQRRLAYEVRGMAQHDDRPQPKLGSDAGCSCGDGAAKGPADAVRQLKRLYETDTLLDSDFDRVVSELECGDG